MISVYTLIHLLWSQSLRSSLLLSLILPPTTLLLLIVDKCFLMSYNSKLHNYDFLASFFSGIAILPSLLLFLSTAVWAIANHVISSLFAAQIYIFNLCNYLHGRWKKVEEENFIWNWRYMAKWDYNNMISHKINVIW